MHSYTLTCIIFNRLRQLENLQEIFGITIML